MKNKTDRETARETQRQESGRKWFGKSIEKYEGVSPEGSGRGGDSAELENRAELPENAVRS